MRLRVARPTVGVDIGSAFVKAAAVDLGGGQPLLTRVSQAAVAEGAVVDGDPVDAAAVAAAVREAVGDLGVTPGRVVTGLPGRDVMIKTIRMERIAAGDAREAIEWAAEQYVPFPMDEVCLDFQLLDADGASPQMEVALAAARRERVERRVELLRAAGVDSPAVDVEAFALGSAFAHNYPGSERGMSALVNVGHEGSSIQVFREGVPVSSRELRGGTRSGVDAEELASGIERVLAFLAIEGTDGVAPSTVHLCGGGAATPDLVERLAGRLKRRVEIANPLQRLRVHPEASVRLPRDGSATAFTVAIGLALRDGTVNLARLERVPGRESPRATLALGAAVVVAGVTAGAMWTFAVQKEGWMGRVLSEAADSARLARLVDSVSWLRVRADSLQALDSLEREGSRRRYQWSHLLDAVGEALPAGSRLTAIRALADPDGFALEGDAGSAESLAEFMEALEASRFVQRVALVSGLDSTFALEAWYEVP